MSATRRKKHSKSLKEKWIPHNFQKLSVLCCLLERKFAVLLDPGLGKTSIILKLFSILKKRKTVKAMLVVAPLRPAFMAWAPEVKKWKEFSGLSLTVLHNDWGKSKDRSLREKHDVYVINPEGLKWLYGKFKNKNELPFDMLVVDESTKFRNMYSERSKILKKLIPFFSRRYILTGSPTPKSLIDIQGQMLIVDEGGTFGSTKKYFHEKYCKQVGKREWSQYVIRNKKCRDEIHRKLKKISIRLEAKDYLNLPEKIDNIISIEMPKKVKKKYNEMVNKNHTVINGNEIYGDSPPSVAIKLWQMANGAIYHELDELDAPVPSEKRKYHVLHDEKLKALEALRDELEYKPLLIAYNFVHDAKRLKKYFGKDIVFLESASSMRDVKKIEERWNNGEISMLAAYPGTAALGLNLQKCGSDVVWFSLVNDLEAFEQFPKRIWRQGMSGTCLRNHILVISGSVDEILLNRMRKKESNQMFLSKTIKTLIK